jgi:hypothetical protein
VVLHHIAHWWDGLELWIAGLPFVPQVLLILAVMVPVSFAIAGAVDRVLHVVLDTFHDPHDADRRASESLPGDRGNGMD